MQHTCKLLATAGIFVCPQCALPQVAEVQAYIDAVNKKHVVFRDVIIEADYNPMACARGNIRVATGDITDPVKLDAEKAAHEASMVRTLCTPCAALGQRLSCCVSCGANKHALCA